MPEVLLWTALSAIAGLIVACGTLLKWVAALASQLTLAEAKAGSAESAAGIAVGKCELLGTEFHNNRAEMMDRVSEIRTKVDYAANAIVQAENRLAKSMDEFGERLDRIADRLDRVLLERREVGGHP